MAKIRQDSPWRCAFSQLAVAVSLALLLFTCRTCIPAVGDAVDRLLAHARHSSAWQAFARLSDAFGEGDGVREVFARLGQVLQDAGG